MIFRADASNDELVQISALANLIARFGVEILNSKVISRFMPAHWLVVLGWGYSV